MKTWLKALIPGEKLGETAPSSYDISELAVDPEDPVVKTFLEFGKETTSPEISYWFDKQSIRADWWHGARS